MLLDELLADVAALSEAEFVEGRTCSGGRRRPACPWGGASRAERIRLLLPQGQERRSEGEASYSPRRRRRSSTRRRSRSPRRAAQASRSRARMSRWNRRIRT